MSSPFLIYNIGVLMFVITAFVVGLYLIFSNKANTFLSRYSIFPQVLFRAFTIIYTAFLAIVLFNTVLFFVDIEVSNRSRECWKRNYEWKNVQVGMTQKQVVQILGQPSRQDNWSGLRYSYERHPLDYISMTEVTFDPNSATTVDNLKVISKYPDDTRMAEDLSEWLPHQPGFAYDNALERISNISAPFAFFSLVILAILSLIPFNLRDKWTARMLYIPLATLVFVVVYEHHQADGWRFDLFLLYPLYAVILICWLVRLIIVFVKSEKERR